LFLHVPFLDKNGLFRSHFPVLNSLFVFFFTSGYECLLSIVQVYYSYTCNYLCCHLASEGIVALGIMLRVCVHQAAYVTYRIHAALVSAVKVVCCIQFCFVMSGSCRDLLHAHFKDGLPEMAAAYILRDVLLAIDYLHNRGIIHRCVYC